MSGMADEGAPSPPAALLLDIADHPNDLAFVAAAQIQMPAERIVAWHVHFDEGFADYQGWSSSAGVGSREHPAAQQRNAQHAEILGRDVEHICDLRFGVHAATVQTLEP